MIWRTRFSSLAVSTRPQNETVSSKCFRSPTAAADAVTSRVGHPEEKGQRNLTRLLYGANGQSPGPSYARMHKAEPYATQESEACPSHVCPLLTAGAVARLSCMQNEGFLYVAAAVLCVSWLVTPDATHAARDRGFNLSINGDAESCADLKVRSKGETAQVNESFTLSKGEAPILELNAADRGQIRVRGWDRADYSVETCKIAAAETRGAAEEAVRGIRVGHSAGRISYNGPAGDSADWMAVFLIHAPRDASLDLEARNGPIEVRGVNGSVKLRATN